MVNKGIKFGLLTVVMMLQASQSVAAPDRSELNQKALEQARAVVAEMTPEEKAGLIDMGSKPVERLGIPRHHWWNEALHGVARAGKATSYPIPLCMASTWNPGLVHEMAVAIGDEARAMHHAADPETAAKRYRGLTIWSPTVNMARDPRWGRTEETYGEDPLLASKLAVSFVTGLQGDNPEWLKTVSTLKHFVANNTEHNRYSARPSISERALREYYLPAFRAGVEEGKVESIMTAYNGINGTPCTVNRWLLTDLLRDEWSFSGTVVTDVGCPGHLTQKHHFTKNGVEASAGMIKAGVHIQSGSNGGWALEAVKAGLLTQQELDESIAQNLATRIKLGLLRSDEDNPYNKISEDVIGCEKHVGIARQIAREGIVLLKNENNVLPATPEKYDRILIGGPYMNSAPLGGYSGTPTHTAVSAAVGLPEVLGGDYKVQTLFGGSLQPVPGRSLHVPGDPSTPGLNAEYFKDNKLDGGVKAQRIDEAPNFTWARPLENVDPDVPQPVFSVRWTGVLTPNRSGTHVFAIEAHDGARVYIDGKKILDIWSYYAEHEQLSEPVELTAGKPVELRVEYYDRQLSDQSSVCLKWIEPLEEQKPGNPQRELMVYVGGMTHSMGTESRDFQSLEIPKEQMTEIRELAEIYPNLLVVLTGGTAPQLGELDELVPAIMMEWFPGQQGGYALADLIGGVANPSGRLPLSFYADVTKLPDFENYEINKGRTYQFATNNVVYPFGHGLSYSPFEYGEVAVSKSECAKDETLMVSVEVSNVGKRDGDEVVQLYVSNLDSAVYQPKRQLKGFKRIHIPAGKSVTVELPLEIETLGWWDEWNDGFTVNSGGYELQVGASSSDIRVRKTIHIK
ncbi:glycoside hydrolase family 3 N-terminal domain-containing protein [Pontiellaceae bacterium B12227]|nr:glycoside hydrolase family 3 N-terminal domain-containing protein [Pontiellaceae bacterium B12227]